MKLNLKGRLDGKKKFTATLSAIIASMLALFLAPEHIETSTQMIAVLAPLVFGGIYDVIQCKQDVEKEKTQQAVAVIKARELPKVEPVMPTVPIAEPEPAPEFDMAAFMEKLDPGGKLNAVNRFYEYRHEGMKTKCHHLEHALAYVDRYIELAQKAIVEVAGYPIQDAEKQLSKDRGDCPYLTVDSMARQEGWIALLKSYRQALNMLRFTEDLDDIMEENPIDWKYKLDVRATLYGVVSSAEKLLKAPV